MGLGSPEERQAGTMVELEQSVLIRRPPEEVFALASDPKKDPDARLYKTISYRDVMLEELRVMDQTAITLCKENQLPLIVLNIHTPGAALRAGWRGVLSPVVDSWPSAGRSTSN